MIFDFENLVNRDHPLNYKREMWALMLNNDPRFSGGASGTTGRPYPDLMGNYPGVINNGAVGEPNWIGAAVDFQSILFDQNGSNGGYVDFGGASGLDFTDDFTVGCTFVTFTVAPTPTAGLAGLVDKSHTTGNQAWYLRQDDQAIGFGGATEVLTGNVLSVGVRYRCIATCAGGTGTIYLDGVAVQTGSPTFVPSADTVRLGVDFGVTNPRYFYGWIGDAFVASRPWTLDDVTEDFRLQKFGYRSDYGPLRMLRKPKKYFPSSPAPTPVSFTTSVGVSQNFLFANPARFTTTLRPRVTAGGIGPLVPGGPAEFVTEVDVNDQFVAGQPTLVNFQTSIGVTNSLAGGSPVEFETVVGVDQSLRTIPNGSLRRLADRRYRR